MYDPIIGRFISPDTIVQDWYDPQKLNRYCYVRNNPLKYTDPTGHITVGELIDEKAMSAASQGRSGALFGWAFAKAAWSAFGAESVSKVADNIATSRNDATAGDVAGAALDVVTLGKGGGAVVAGKKLGEKFGGKLLSKAKGLLNASKSEDILVLGRGPKSRLERLAAKEGGHISTTSSNVPKDIFKKNYSDIRKADKIVQYMDDIPTTLDEARKTGGQYSRAEVYMINQRKDLLEKTIRKIER